MADSKITALTSISTSTDPAVDPLVIVDVSDTSMAASGTSKKVTVNQILGSGGTATLASATITGALTVDTTTLVVDSTNNRVGICIASPTEALTIDNTTGVTTGAIRVFAGDQSLSRIAIQNLNGQAYHLVAGKPGASDVGFALYDYTSSATRFYVDTSGNLLVGVTSTNANGGVLQLKSGITFPATQVAASDANTLDDYEEGTFTPSIGGTATYTQQTGRYTKIGNRVHVTLRCTVLLRGTGSTYEIAGLPFALSASSPGAAVSIGFFMNLATSVYYLSGYASGSGVNLTGTTSLTANVTNAIAAIGNGTDIATTFCYEV